MRLIDADALLRWLDNYPVTEKFTIEHFYNMVKDMPDNGIDEWCTDCKEYDHEHHCCPRWNRVIRETLKDARTKNHTMQGLQALGRTWTV